jgi:hypothetical protein
MLAARQQFSTGPLYFGNSSVKIGLVGQPEADVGYAAAFA